MVLATLALCAFFFASGLSDLFAAMHLRASAPAAVDRRTGEELPLIVGSIDGAPDARLILKRNIFDPSSGPLWPPKPALATEAVPSGAMSAPECKDPVRVIAAFVSDERPSASFVSLSIASATAHVYRPGDSVDGKQIESIGSEYVVMRAQGGALCSISMFERPPPLLALAAMSSEEAVLSEKEIEENITQVGESEFHVQRVLFERVFGDPSYASQLARIERHRESGKPAGLKISGIHRDSVLGKLGLHNGDLLRSINGFDLSKIADAPSLYGAISESSAVSVEVTRRGSGVAIKYLLN